MPATAASAKRKPTTAKARPEIIPARNYTVSESALAVGVSDITIWRALESDRLKCFRVGRRVICSGQHLLDWLKSGGKTTK